MLRRLFLTSLLALVATPAVFADTVYKKVLVPVRITVSEPGQPDRERVVMMEKWVAVEVVAVPVPIAAVPVIVVESRKKPTPVRDFFFGK